MTAELRENSNRIGDKDGIVVAAALIGAPPLELGHYAQLAVKGGADAIHIDVMDGHFVPPITFGHAVVSQLRAVVNVPVDVHLLVANPDKHVQQFIDAGADIVTIHIEAVTNAYRSLQEITRRGVRAGIAINPGTPLSAIEEIVPLIDLLMIMTVDPGTSELIPAMVRKVGRARSMLDSAGRTDVPIVADGGVKTGTIGELAVAGARWFVAASAIFGHPTRLSEAIIDLKHSARAALRR